MVAWNTNWKISIEYHWVRQVMIYNMNCDLYIISLHQDSYMYTYH
jgi:hypothetical protein